MIFESAIQHKNGVAIKVFYECSKTGLTCLKIKPVKPDGTELTPIAMSTFCGCGYIYKGEFTPDVVGVWTVKVYSSAIEAYHKVCIYEVVT